MYLWLWWLKFCSFHVSKHRLKHLHSKWRGHYCSRSKRKEQRYSYCTKDAGFLSHCIKIPLFSKHENVWLELAKLSLSAKWIMWGTHVKLHEEALISESKSWLSATFKLSRSMRNVFLTQNGAKVMNAFIWRWYILRIKFTLLKIGRDTWNWQPAHLWLFILSQLPFCVWLLGWCSEKYLEVSAVASFAKSSDLAEFQVAIFKQLIQFQSLHQTSRLLFNSLVLSDVK